MPIKITVTKNGPYQLSGDLAELEQPAGQMGKRLSTRERQRCVADDLRLPQQLYCLRRLATRSQRLREQHPKADEGTRPQIETLRA